MNLHLKHWLQTGTVFFCAFLLTFFSASARADETTADLQKKTSSLKGQLKNLNSEMVSISDQIAATEMDLEITNNSVLEIQYKLAQAQEAETRQYEDMKARIKFMYESGNTSLLEMLFSAKDMSDFLNKAEFIQNISDYDRAELEELRAMHEEIAAEAESLTKEQESLVELREQLQAKKDSLAKTAESTSTDLTMFLSELSFLREEEARKAAEEARQEAQQANDDSDPILQTTTVNASADDLTLLAAIIESESYQDYNALLAVATVILNRLESPRYGDTLGEVIYSPGQFSPVRNGTMDRVLQKGPTALSYEVAQDALNGARLSEVLDCYYFLWAGGTNRTGVTVGDNLFFSHW